MRASSTVSSIKLQRRSTHTRVPGKSKKKTQLREINRATYLHCSVLRTVRESISIKVQYLCSCLPSVYTPHLAVDIPERNFSRIGRIIDAYDTYFIILL